MAIEASQKVRKLTGHDNVFRIHFIGELKIQNTSQRARKLPIKLIMEFSIDGLENEILIHNE